MRTGIVMEGGGMRGMFTAGVIDVLMENGIYPDGAVGASAGAVFGVNYKSRQIGRAIRYNERFCRDKRFCSIKSLRETGDMFGAEFCYHELPEKHDYFDVDAYAENPMEFYIVCTELLTGNAVYHKSEKVDYTELEWMRASASMPLASRVVEIGDYKLLDGGMADSVPIRFFENLGFNRCVVVLTQPEGYVKKKNMLMPFIKRSLKSYPKAVETMGRRHIVYNETIEYIKKREKEGKVLVIRPDSKIKAGRTERNPKKLREAYNQGRRACEESLGKIKTFWDKQ